MKSEQVNEMTDRAAEQFVAFLSAARHVYLGPLTVD
jgi:hypothetical protein